MWPSGRPPWLHVASLYLYLDECNQTEYPIRVGSINSQLCGVPLKTMQCTPNGSPYLLPQAIILPMSRARLIRRHPISAGGLLHAAPYRLRTEVTSEPSGHPSLVIHISSLKGDDCSVTNCAIIMTIKVKKSSQHKYDIVSDTIKTLFHLKIEVHVHIYTREAPS